MDRDPAHIMQIGLGFWPRRPSSPPWSSSCSPPRLRRPDRRGDRRPCSGSTRGAPRLPRRARRARLLAREGDGPEARYANTAETAASSTRTARPTSAGSSRWRTTGSTASGAIWRGAADRQPAERDQAPAGRCSRSSTRSRPPRAVHGGDGGISPGNFGRSPRSSTSRGTRRCATSAARRACSRSLVAEPSPAPPLPQLRPAPVEPIARAQRSRRRVAERVTGRVRRLLRRSAPEGRRHHDGHDPARLEPREEEAADPAAYEALPTAARSSRSRT